MNTHQSINFGSTKELPRFAELLLSRSMAEVGLSLLPTLNPWAERNAIAAAGKSEVRAPNTRWTQSMQ